MTFRLEILKRELGDLTKYKYCGGDYGCHENYFRLLCKTHKYIRPEKKYSCVCEQSIVNNCYITNDNNTLIVMGSCCIKRFLPEKSAGRTCEKCNNPHKNRIINLCNDCRTKKHIPVKQSLPKKCLNCDKQIDPKYIRCYKCFEKHRNGN